MADADATIAALQTQVAAFSEQLTLLQQQKASEAASSSSGPVSNVKVLAIAATSDTSSIPRFKQLGDVPHVDSNPIRRATHFPVDPQLIDLKGSRGFEAVAEGGVPSMLHEYRHHASFYSYLHDYTAAYCRSSRQRAARVLLRGADWTPRGPALYQQQAGLLENLW